MSVPPHWELLDWFTGATDGHSFMKTSHQTVSFQEAWDEVLFNINPGLLWKTKLHSELFVNNHDLEECWKLKVCPEYKIFKMSELLHRLQDYCSWREFSLFSPPLLSFFEAMICCFGVFSKCILLLVMINVAMIKHLMFTVVASGQFTRSRCVSEGFQLDTLLGKVWIPFQQKGFSLKSQKLVWDIAKVVQCAQGFRELK